MGEPLNEEDEDDARHGICWMGEKNHRFMCILYCAVRDCFYVVSKIKSKWIKRCYAEILKTSAKMPNSLFFQTKFCVLYGPRHYFRFIVHITSLRVFFRSLFFLVFFWYYCFCCRCCSCCCCCCSFLFNKGNKNYI